MITKEDLATYRELNQTKINLFNINILLEIYSNDDVDHIADEKLLSVANIVKDCCLKDEAGYSLGEIVNAVLLNYKDIKEQDLSPREILARFI